MHEGNALQFLCTEVRRKTIRLLVESPAGSLRWSPPGLQNHILWHAGHALWLMDVLCIQPATGASELPAGWAETFGMNCRPPSTTAHWPSRDEVTDRLRGQGDRLFELLGSLTEHQLYSSPGGRTGDTLLGWIIHGFHDEAKHQGEMWLLRKLWQRTQPVA